MSPRRPLVPQALLLASLLGAFGFLSFYTGLHAKELGEFCALVLFSWLALATRADSRWAVYVLLPALLTGLFSLLYAFVFTLRTDADLFSSVWAQRYYAYVLLGPIVYMLHRRGWGLADFRRVFVTTMVLILAGRIVGDLTVSSTSLLLSGRLFVLQLGPYYDDQTYLFRRMDFSALFLALYFGRRLFSSGNPAAFVFRSSLAALATAVLLVSLPRTLATGAVVALVLYGLFLSRPARARVSALVLPLCLSTLALAVPLLGGLLLSLFRHDLSFLTRSQSSGIALESFADYPIFGFGQDSSRSLSYQDLFGESFYPSDTGLAGVAFQFGLVGVLLYLVFCAWLVPNMLGLSWAGKGRVGQAEWTFLWVLLVACLTFVIISPIQARFIYSEGLPVAAFCWGLLMAHKHVPVDAPQIPPRAPTAAHRRTDHPRTTTEVTP